ncbi:MAG: PHP domain-containing protein [Dehalococcoidia bacterium]|nr:PHP domain-containing protein [Dehalococcoidia bacterium]
MKIDLHVHTKTGSDGLLSADEVFAEAIARNIGLLSITDHDSVDAQERAKSLAAQGRLSYVTGIELSIAYEHKTPDGRTKSISLDFLGYDYNIHDEALRDKLRLIREQRETRARKILANLNTEFDTKGIERFTELDLKKIQDTVDGAFARPHIANYLIAKGIVKDTREAFDMYLVKCDVPKYPLSIAEASKLVRGAGGLLALAHPNDPQGTSLVSITRDLDEQVQIISDNMLDFIDGIECWHSRHDSATTEHYLKFARSRNLTVTGGSDCHQKPILMGTLDIPDWVAHQFNRRRGKEADQNDQECRCER